MDILSFELGKKLGGGTGIFVAGITFVSVSALNDVYVGGIAL